MDESLFIPRENQFERERMPKVVFMLTRHADRLPSGDLSEPGKQKAAKKGTRIGALSDNLAFKGYSSDEKSDRTYLTSEILSEKSGILSPKTNAHYETRRVEHIQYDILRPDFNELLKEAKALIEKKTLEEYALSLEKSGSGRSIESLDDLTQTEQEEIAIVRAKNQVWGFRLILSNPEAVRRMATGLAYQLLDTPLIYLITERLRPFPIR